MFAFTAGDSSVRTLFPARCDAVPSLLLQAPGKTRPWLRNSADPSNHKNRSPTEMQFTLP